jgi:hypothetical protein
VAGRKTCDRKKTFSVAGECAFEIRVFGLDPYIDIGKRALILRSDLSLDKCNSFCMGADPDSEQDRKRERSKKEVTLERKPIFQFDFLLIIKPIFFTFRFDLSTPKIYRGKHQNSMA